MARASAFPRRALGAAILASATAALLSACSRSAETTPVPPIVPGHDGGHFMIDAAVVSSVTNTPDARAALSQGERLSAAAALWSSAGLPPIDDATVAHVLTVHAEGAARGNRDDVFMKIGDSITASPSFLVDLGVGNYTLGRFAALAPTIDAFDAVRFDDNTNSFTRASNAVQSGLTTRALVKSVKSLSWITGEIAAIHPAWAIMMFGTDDLDIMDVDEFVGNYTTIADALEKNGVVLVVSTVPHRPEYARALEQVPIFNDAIRAFAARRHWPIVDLIKALDPLPGRGVGADDVHPSVELSADGGSMSADFTDAGLAYGYNVRNLTTVQIFDRLRAVVKR